MKYNNKLPKEVMDWILEQVNREAKMTDIMKLKGSTSSTLYSITLVIGNDKRDVVLRLFDNKEWILSEPDLAIHEAESLRAAGRLSIPTPNLLSLDSTGEKCGVPAILMTKLMGDVELKLLNREQWVTRLAKVLADIHNLRIDFPYRYESYTTPEMIDIPTWSKVPQAWKSAKKITKNSPPNEIYTFIHRDFHPTNVLWWRGKVSGVVDWVNACLGPKGVDVGHCRWNLAMLYGVDVADQFLKSYCKYMGDEFTYYPYWDIVSLCDVLSDPVEVYPGWEAFGVRTITKEVMEERMDQYVLSLLKRF